MEQKDTSEIVKELQLCPDFKEFFHENEPQMIQKSLPQLLQELMAAKALTRMEVIRRSNLNENYAHQIFSGLRAPERKKLLALAFGMELSLEETQRLLKSTGYPPLYAKLPFDCVVIYGRIKNLSVLETNELLLQYRQEILE